MERQSFIRWTAIALFIAVAVGCHEEPVQITRGPGCGTCEDPPSGGGTVGLYPTVNSFNPTRGIIGTSVTISGSNFSSTPSYNIVTFDGVQGQVISSGYNTIVARVPPGVTTGKISVIVGGVTTTSSSDFQVLDIPLNGLVAFYTFEGNANDLTEVPSNGSVTGGAQLVPDRHGRPSNAYSFVNGGGEITMGNPPELQITGQITLSAWLNVSIGSSGCPILKDYSTSQSCSGYRIIQVHHTGGRNVIGLSSNDGSASLFRTIGIGINQWVFITMTLNGTTAKYYLNGVLVSTHINYQPITTNNNGDFKINGVSCSGHSGYIGLVDDVAIYNRDLSDQEVLQLFQQNILQ